MSVNLPANFDHEKGSCRFRNLLGARRPIGRSARAPTSRTSKPAERASGIERRASRNPNCCIPLMGRVWLLGAQWWQSLRTISRQTVPSLSLRFCNHTWVGQQRLDEGPECPWIGPRGTLFLTHYMPVTIKHVLCVRMLRGGVAEWFKAAVLKTVVG